jgi:hypothetical protein
VPPLYRFRTVRTFFNSLGTTMPASICAAPVRVGVRITEDHAYYRSPIGESEILAEEHAHFTNGTWAAYQLTTVVECPHCGHRYGTDVLGGQVVEKTSLVDSIVWADDPWLAADSDDYLAASIRSVIGIEQDNPTPPMQ